MIEEQPQTKVAIAKRDRLLRVILVLYLLGIILVSLAPGNFVPNGSQLHLDKVGHFLAYTGLGFLLGLTVKTRNGRFVATFCAIGMGFLLEGGQFFVPGRDMSLADGLVNTSGILLGLLLYRKWGQPVSVWLDRFLA